MRYQIEQLGFDLRVRIEEPLPLAMADADAMQQAVLNLLSNAVKYSGDARLIEMSLTKDRDDP